MISCNNFISSALKPIDLSSFQTSKTTSDDKKSIKKYKTCTYAGAGAITVLFGSMGYSVAHDDFKNQKNEIIKNNNNKLNAFVDLVIKKLKTIEGNISQSKIDEIINTCNECYARKLDKSITKLRNNFKSIYINKTIGGTLCGAIIGALGINKMYTEIKQTKQ